MTVNLYRELEKFGGGGGLEERKNGDREGEIN